jgi:hypothetical protein
VGGLVGRPERLKGLTRLPMSFWRPCAGLFPSPTGKVSVVRALRNPREPWKGNFADRMRWP